MSETVQFASYSMRNETKPDRDWFDWCVFVDPGSKKSNQIKSVEYLLHPSFPDPRRIASDPSNCFALFSNGWGEFSLKISVGWNDGTVTSTSYYLHLVDEGWPKAKDPKQLSKPSEQAVYNALKNSTFRWRRLTTIVKHANLSLEQVKVILKNFEQKNLTRKAFFNAVDGEELWGATSVVGISPRPDAHLPAQ